MKTLNLKYHTEPLLADEFVDIFINWITTTKDFRYKLNLCIENHSEFDADGIFIGESFLYSEAGKVLSLIRADELNMIAFKFSSKDRNNIEWTTSFCYDYAKNDLFIMVQNSLTSESSFDYSNNRKPDFIDELIEIGVKMTDSGLSVDYCSEAVMPNDTAELIEIYKGKVKHNLPVVYVSENRYGYYDLDVKLLADELSGIAHVYVQQGGDFVVDELKDATDDNIVTDGAVEVFYFNNKITRKILSKKKCKNQQDYFKNIKKNVYQYLANKEYGKNTTYDEIAQYTLLHRNAVLQQSKEEIANRNNQIVNENTELMSMYSEDVEKLEREVEFLTRRVKELEREKSILESKLSYYESDDENEASNMTLSFHEDELYPGEVKAIVVDILKHVPLNDKSRRADIVNDIVASNDCDTVIEERLALLKSALIDYDLNPRSARSLEALGFKIESDGKHHKLIYHDPRYQISISKTTSDTYHGGKNAISYINSNFM